MQYVVAEEHPSGKFTPLAHVELPSVAEAIARFTCEFYGRPMIVMDAKNKDAITFRTTPGKSNLDLILGTVANVSG